MTTRSWSAMALGCLFSATLFGQADNIMPVDPDEEMQSVLIGHSFESLDAVTPAYQILDAGRLEAFLDGTIKTAMEDHHLPGVTVSVVQDGQLILAKGYGLARTNPPQPVVADQTLFRIGSISKTFTFSAVMQLVEQGLLDLTADIGPIMQDVKINDAMGPLSMVDLMTHSAGFEDSYVGHFYADGLQTDHEPTAYLNRYAPHRVRKPGEQIVYSNFGTELAGKVIESVSGENFTDYMDAHIFQPLGMTRSSFREYPLQVADGYLDAALQADRAMGYQWAGGQFVPYDDFFLPRAAYPAGSVSATATDMAVFMLAHLNGGAIDGKRILATATVEQMHTRLRGNAEGIQGNAHGFWTGQVRGYRTVEHGGAVLGFLSDMVLVPELGLGIFVSTNGDAGRGSVTALPRRVIENFYPALTTPPQPDPEFAAQREAYAGKYLGNRRGYETIDKLAALGSETTVSVTDEGYLLTTTGQGTQRWLPLGNHVFENVVDGSRMAFEVGPSGVASRLYVAYGHNVADRVSLLGSSQFFYAAAGATLVLACGSLFGFWLRRGRRLPQSGGENLAAFGLGLTSLAWLVFFVAFAMFMAGVSGPEPEILVRYPTPVALVMIWAAMIAAGLAALCIFGLLPVWRTGSWSIWRRLRHTVVVLAGLALVWALNDWNLLGFRYLGA
jgi:CubicO group peptidase (beta-lactamase class C family)